MEVGHESPAGCAIVDKLVGKQVGLNAADAKTLYAFNLVESLDKVDEAFVALALELACVYTC